MIKISFIVILNNNKKKRKVCQQCKVKGVCIHMIKNYTCTIIFKQ